MCFAHDGLVSHRLDIHRYISLPTSDVLHAISVVTRLMTTSKLAPRRTIELWLSVIERLGTRYKPARPGLLRVPTCLHIQAFEQAEK